MDLIYTDNNMNDVGVLQDYTLDMAYGLDENDFEIKMALHKPECEAGNYIYIEGTEFGGVIDGITSDTVDDTLIYSGRTWHGILATKVIEPDEGAGYYIASGEANSVVADIIDRCDLSDVFDVSTEDSEIIIDDFSFRYDDVNTALFCMLQEYDAKLIIRWENRKVKLHVELLMNYAAQEELDSSQLQFTIKRQYINCNHLICLGQGQLADRYVIHLFTDEGGGVQPYSTADPPYKDSQYILDKSRQVLYNRDEYTEVYDYAEADVTENYEMLDVAPADWTTNYPDYYERSEDSGEDEEDNYNQLERNIQDVYNVLDSKPSDWDSAPENYYTEGTDPETGGTVYEQIEPKEAYTVAVVSARNWTKTYNKYYHKVGSDYEKIGKIPTYKRLTKRPKDWTKKYSNYYVRDGHGNYSTVSGATKYKYKLQTMEPSDWNHGNDWKEYYIKRQVNKKATYVQIKNDSTLKRRSTAPKWKKNTYYDKVSYTVAPQYVSTIDYYSKKMVIPDYNYYSTKYKLTKENPNKWAANTYYSMEPDVDVGIDFVSGSFFRKVLDHYAVLVAGGIERLAELNNADEMEVTRKMTGVSYINEMEQSVLDTEFEYDVGDIIGGNEEISGVYISQPVTKKIVKIENDVVDIEYEAK